MTLEVFVSTKEVEDYYIHCVRSIVLLNHY